MSNMYLKIADKMDMITSQSLFIWFWESWCRPYMIESERGEAYPATKVAGYKVKPRNQFSKSQ